MEQSGFKVQTYYRTSKYIVDVYGVLPTILGDIGVVVACKNYEERWKVGMEVLKDMEMTAKALHASKIVIITTSDFSPNAVSYAERRGIKLIDKDGIMALAKKFSKNTEPDENTENTAEVIEEDDEDYDPSKSKGSSFMSRGKKGSLSGRTRSEVPGKLEAWIKAVLSSTIGLIIIVLALSYILSALISSGPVQGILRIFLAAVFSYGIVIALERDLMVTLIRGSTVFFVTLIIYIALIFYQFFI